MKIKVGILFGGCSVEHEVSIITAVQAMEYFDKEKYEVIPIYIDKNRRWFTGENLLKMDSFKDLETIENRAIEVHLVRQDKEFILIKAKGLLHKQVGVIDVAFPIVHGKGVEDGSLAGYLDTLGIPYVGPDMLGASLGQDKVVQKQVLSADGIPVTQFVWFYENDYLTSKDSILKDIKKLGYPVIVKPARLGSSIGISFVKEEHFIEEAIESALLYDEKVLVEEVVPNLVEVDCAVVGNYESMETSLIGEMNTTNAFLTFDDKYLSEGGKKSCKSESTTGFKIPAVLDKEVEEKIYDYSKKAFRSLNLKGITRFDFLVNQESKEVYVNEPNTIPGCLAFFFFTKKGKTYTQLLDECVSMTIKDYKNTVKKVTSFESNVLSTYNGSKGGKGKMN
ncbi:MAG: D-alanine--D-alanine ligase [Bacilli bacterium]|nr:D-alanine--D-alanine ligase [Bacilli bacterium]